MSQGPGAPTVVSAARLKDNSGKRPLARQHRGQKLADEGSEGPREDQKRYCRSAKQR